MYSAEEDIVTLDGMYPGRDWPVGLAEDLLNDPSPWSVGYDRTLPDQRAKVAEVASFVNGFNRRALSPKLAVERIQHRETLEDSSTQELLDMLNVIWRMERHVGGGLTQIEPSLRELLRIVVTRVRSSTPPHFVPAS